MCHATSAVIAVTSRISSFGSVDTQKVWMTGAPFGSVITCIMVSFDDRISFVMPIYGGLSLMEKSSM